MSSLNALVHAPGAGGVALNSWGIFTTPALYPGGPMLNPLLIYHRRRSTPHGTQEPRWLPAVHVDGVPLYGRGYLGQGWQHAVAARTFEDLSAVER